MKDIKKCLILSMVSFIFLLVGGTLQETNIEQKEEPMVDDQKIYYFYDMYLGQTKLRMMFYNIDAKLEEPMGLFEEEVSDEFNCLFYECESIGRYYITAYNHKETGSKITASGKTCHEGTITTCAADPQYHKFGEYLEIDGRLYIVEDTGSAVKKRHIDLYFADYKSMARYGSNYQEIYKVTFPFGKPKQK